MLRAGGARLVLLDASVPHRFCEAQMLPQLMTYLGASARITPEVAAELKRSARGQRFAGLRLLERAAWPEVTDVLLPDLRVRFEHYRRAAQQPGDPPTRHIGEITTVLMAAHLKADLVIIDDELGKRLARKHQLDRISTAQLALEMVAYGALDEAEGLIVFNLSSNNAGEPVFRLRLEERRRAEEA